MQPPVQDRTRLTAPARPDLGVHQPRTVVTRRHLQIVLGLFWLLDGALQFQPFMFTRSFAEQVIAPLGQGQPSFVAVPVQWASDIIAAHPFAWNIPFATLQVALGIAILVPRTARLGLAASVAWAAGVWFFGEGLSGLADGHASLLSGAPGAALLYGVLALAAWPRRGRPHDPPAAWLLAVWTVLWIGAAIFQTLPGQNSGSDVATIVSGSAGNAPGWLASLDGGLATWIGRHGTVVVVTLVVCEALIGIAILFRSTRRYAAVAGLAVAVAIWLFCQSAGALTTGQATDPNTAAILAVVAVVMLGIRGSGAATIYTFPGHRERAATSYPIPDSPPVHVS
jgi:hypothetical protein